MDHKHREQLIDNLLEAGNKCHCGRTIQDAVESKPIPFEIFGRENLVLWICPEPCGSSHHSYAEIDDRINGRCEDFPCCGHASDPGGCPSAVARRCKDCGKSFYPDALTYDYCYVCGSKPATPVRKPAGRGKCNHCGDDERDLVEALKTVACRNCHDEWDGEREFYDREI